MRKFSFSKSPKPLFCLRRQISRRQADHFSAQWRKALIRVPRHQVRQARIQGARAHPSGDKIRHLFVRLQSQQAEGPHPALWIDRNFVQQLEWQFVRSAPEFCRGGQKQQRWRHSGEHDVHREHHKNRHGSESGWESEDNFEQWQVK